MASSKINGYTITKRLKGGGQGTAFVCVDNHGSEWVIKISKFEEVSELNAVLKESQIAIKLRHPNVAFVKEAFVHSDERMESAFCQIMKFYTDGDLQTVIEKRPKNKSFSEEFILSVTRQIASALEFLHNAHVVHRDVKPANIFLMNYDEKGENTTFVLGDFGLCKEIENTYKHTASGTQLFMAPEVANGEPYSFEADLFSLGCVIYNLMAKRPINMLFEWATKGEQKVLANMMSMFSKEYTKELIDLTFSLLHLERKLRPSATEVLEILPKIEKALEFNKLTKSVSYAFKWVKPIIESVEPGAEDYSLRIWPTLVWAPSKSIKYDGSGSGTVDRFYLYGGQERGKRTFLHHLREITLSHKADGKYHVKVAPVNTPFDEKLKILAGHRAVVAGNSMYVFGGVEEHNNYFNNDLFVFDLASKKWSKPTLHGDIPTAREGHSMTVTEDEKRIWMFAGGDEDGLRADLFVLDLPTMTFERIQPTERDMEFMPKKSFYHTANIIKDNLYIVGGIRGNDRSIQQIFVFDIVKRRWLPPVPVKTPSVYTGEGLSEHTSLNFGNDDILIYGGRLKTGVRKRSELTIFNSSKNILFDELPQVGSGFARGGHAMAKFNNKYLLIGGASDIDATEDIMVLESSNFSTESHLQQLDQRMYNELKTAKSGRRFSDVAIMF